MKIGYRCSHGVNVVNQSNGWWQIIRLDHPELGNDNGENRGVVRRVWQEPPIRHGQRPPPFPHSAPVLLSFYRPRNDLIPLGTVEIWVPRPPQL